MTLASCDVEVATTLATGTTLRVVEGGRDDTGELRCRSRYDGGEVAMTVASCDVEVAMTVANRDVEVAMTLASRDKLLLDAKSRRKALELRNGHAGAFRAC